MNVLFKCCKCNSKEAEIRKDVHSYSWNNSLIKEPLCEHFPEVSFSWKTKYGFFTLGWKVEIYDVEVRCQCKRSLEFQNQTFQADHPNYEDYHECCDHVVLYSAHEGKYSYGNEAFELQNRINEERKEIKELEEKIKKEREKANKLEQEEKLKKENEEKRKKERENMRRMLSQRENRELNKLIKRQIKENEEINSKVDTDIDWISNDMNRLNETSDVTRAIEETFNAKQVINNNMNHKVIQVKSSG